MYRIRCVELGELDPVEYHKQEPEHEFNIGDRVKWFSSGTWKSGEIVAIVFAGECPPILELTDNYSFKSYGGGSPRKEVSYLIALDPLKRCFKRKLYWPVAKILILDNGTKRIQKRRLCSD